MVANSSSSKSSHQRAAVSAGSDEQFTNTQFIVVSTAYFLSAAFMIISNKGSIRFYPFPSTLLFLQNALTVIQIWGLFKYKPDLHRDFDWNKAKVWIPCATLFLIMLYTSLKAMIYVSLPTLVVFRNLNSIITAIADFFVSGRRTSLRALACLFLIVVGGLVYGWNDLEFNFIGYAWTFTNIGCMAAYSLVVKNYAMKAHSYTPFEMSLYNNLESLPGLLFALILSPEIQKGSLSELFQLGQAGVIYVTLSCVTAFAISTSGFFAQKMLSPTAWITLNNVNKIPLFFLSAYLFDDLMTVRMGTGLVIGLVGGFLYSYVGLLERQEMERRQAAHTQQLSGHSLIPSEDDDYSDAAPLKAIQKLSSV